MVHRRPYLLHLHRGADRAERAGAHQRLSVDPDAAAAHCAGLGAATVLPEGGGAGGRILCAGAALLDAVQRRVRGRAQAGGVQVGGAQVRGVAHADDFRGGRRAAVVRAAGLHSHVIGAGQGGLPGRAAAGPLHRLPARQALCQAASLSFFVLPPRCHRPSHGQTCIN